MTDVEYRGQMPLDVTIVPARVAYLVRDGSRDGFRRAVQEASTRWAGQTEPILPVMARGIVEGWAHDVVELARVDGAVNVDLSVEEARVAAEALGLDWVPLASIDRWGPAMWTCHPGWVSGSPAAGVQAVVIATATGELWQIVAAGDLTAEHLAATDPAILPTRRGLSADDIGRAQLGGNTMLDRTIVSFGETFGSQALGAGPTVVWVTDGEDLRDCWEFWNFRALCPIRFSSMPTILLPRNEIHHWLKFDEQFAHTLRRAEEFSPDVLLTSINLPDSDLEEIADLLHLERINDDIRLGHRYPASIRQAPFTYDIVREPQPLVAFNRVYGTSAQVDIHIFDHGAIVRFVSPVQFRGGYTLMRFGGVPFRGLPRRPVVATLVHPNAVWCRDTIQLNVAAMSEYLFQIRVPSLQEATHALLANATVRYQLSDKGQVADRLQRDIDLILLRQPYVFDVIRQLTTPRTKHFIDAVEKRLKDEPTKEILKSLAGEWGGRSERRMLSAYQLSGGAKSDNIAALELLCGVTWAERGLQIKCTDCRITSFIPLDTIAPRGYATCPACGSRQGYSRGMSEISIFYRLDGRVDWASDQGIMPHLLTIAELGEREAPSWFLPGVDVWFADEIHREVDIFGVHAGRVVVGEVKVSSSEFTEIEITKNVDTCTRLGADIFVMAATGDITSESQERAKFLCDPAGIDLVVLSRSDLLPGR